MGKDTVYAERRDKGAGSVTRPASPATTPGMFRTSASAALQIAKWFGISTVLTMVVVGFVLAVIRQPVEAVMAGVGCVCFSGAFLKISRREKDWGWQLIGGAASLWLLVMAALAWGVV